MTGFSAAALLAAACGGGTVPPPQVATTSVTPAAGGTVTLPGDALTLEVPAGAVGADTMITVSTTTLSAPDGTTQLSPVLKFEPDGLVFLKPVKVTFAFQNGASNPSVFWSNAAGGYDALGGVVTGSTIAAEVMHFSSGFVGEGSACTEGSSCSAGAKCGIAPPSGSTNGTGGSTGNGGGSDAKDASAPMSNPGSTGTGDAPAATTGRLIAEGTCCACGEDGKYHCGACGTTDPQICAEGYACQPGASCATASGGLNTATPNSGTSPTGTSTTGGDIPASDATRLCCSCGSDGFFHCGTTCGGDSPKPDAGQTGGIDGGPSTTTCTSGADCQPGSACGGESAGGCFNCVCGDDGKLACGSCGSHPDAGVPPSDDAAAPPPACVPGGTCQSGARCVSESQGGCMVCMCGADGLLSCGPCAVQPADGGSSPPPPSCTQGADCPTPGYVCDGHDATGYLKCSCGVDNLMSCQPAGTPATDGGSSPPPPPCVQGADCQTGYACDGRDATGGYLKCSCGADHLLACVPIS